MSFRHEGLSGRSGLSFVVCQTFRWHHCGPTLRRPRLGEIGPQAKLGFCWLRPRRVPAPGGLSNREWCQAIQSMTCPRLAFTLRSNSSPRICLCILGSTLNTLASVRNLTALATNSTMSQCDYDGCGKRESRAIPYHAGTIKATTAGFVPANAAVASGGFSPADCSQANSVTVTAPGRKKSVPDRRPPIRHRLGGRVTGLPAPTVASRPALPQETLPRRAIGAV